jgi:hypothetical protein
LRLISIGIGFVLLSACAATPPKSDTPEPQPEIVLNLPAASTCACDEGGADDDAGVTFLEKGIEALTLGDHISAVQYFQRHQRIERTEAAAWETAVAIAFISTLPSSPFFEPQSSRASFERLSKQYRADMQVHSGVLLMRDSLEMFVSMLDHADDLRRQADGLQDDLDKREKALKRLRDLTLGSREESQ